MTVPEETEPQSDDVSELPAEGAPEPDLGLVPPDLPENTPPQPGEQPQEMLQTECAFLVFKTAEGIWAADSNVGRPIAIGREASFHDMRHAAVDILHGITIQETAQTVIMMQQQVAQGMMKQAAEQRAAAEISQRLGGMGGGVDLSGLKK